MKKTTVYGIILILGMSLMSGCAARGKAGSAIAGKVTEAGTGAFVEGVEIAASLADTKLSATTDSAGEYTIPNLMPGIYKLTASRVGYRTQVHEKVEVKKGKKIKLDLELFVTGGGT
jgi:thymidine phosphorylase